MATADADKWNARFRDGAYLDRTHPTAFLSEWAPRLTTTAGLHAVDLACGAGRNALYLARMGWSVAALDISQVALDRLAKAAAAERLPIECTQIDLDAVSKVPKDSLPPDSLPTDVPPAALQVSARCDLALVVRYTNLPLIERVASLLKTGGVLMVELHLQTDAEVVGPRNPAYRVAPGALRAAAGNLTIADYREGIVGDPDGRPAALAQLLARA